jgi:hypothetical protein
MPLCPHSETPPLFPDGACHSLAEEKLPLAVVFRDPAIVFSDGARWASNVANPVSSIVRDSPRIGNLRQPTSCRCPLTPMRNAFSFSNVATARSRLPAASANAIASRPTSVAPCSATR